MSTRADHSTRAARSRAAHRDDLVPGVSKAQAFFLLAAFLSFAMSVGLFFSGDQMRGIFVGIWVPSILAAGAFLMGGRRHD